jgi:hypothetical protein
MDLRTQILQEYSKEQLQKTATAVAADQQRFDELMQLFLGDEHRVVQRTAWIISMVADLKPGLVQPYLPAMVARMQVSGLPPAVRRNMVRILQQVVIPEALHGEVMNACFGFLSDPKENIAVRCFSMTVLGHLSGLYPEIKPELVTILEDQLEHGASAGFRSRATKTLKLLRKV